MKKSFIILVLMLGAVMLSATQLSLVPSNGGNPEQNRELVDVHYDAENHGAIETEEPGVTFEVTTKYTSEELSQYMGALIKNVKIFVKNSASAVII